MDTSQIVTKKDLAAVKADTTSLKQEVKYVRKDLLKLEERVENIEDDIKDIKADNQIMDGKLDRIQNTLDAFVGAIDDLRTDNTVGTHHTRELQKRVEDHEERLQHIESVKQAS